MAENATYRIAVCDDEKIFRSRLVKCIRSYDDNVYLREYNCGDELLQSDEIFDLIFLDIEMPGTNGMKTAKELRERKIESQIVFLTSHTECVYDAFRVKAFRFLNKPVNAEQVHRTLMELAQENRKEEKVVVSQKGKVFELALNQVVYFEAFGDGTYIYDKYGEVYSSTVTLKEWEEKLQDKGFFRIHKSYMVSLLYVKCRENELLELRGLNVSLKISRRNVGKFAEAYLTYIDKNAKRI
ncbi:MAG: LytTR family DNA-binding domain-containing protein [Lachnospiraceae bacterium]|nr:LytTR family DNA-binding domain-containing protein [Lachnospiraceae bacterium]